MWWKILLAIVLIGGILGGIGASLGREEGENADEAFAKGCLAGAFSTGKSCLGWIFFIVGLIVVLFIIGVLQS